MRKTPGLPFLLFAIFLLLACQMASDLAYGSATPTPTVTTTSAPVLTMPVLSTFAPASATLTPTLPSIDTPITGPVYLSNLEPVSAEVGSARFGVGVWTYTEGDVQEGSVIKSRGIEYPHGLFAHAPSTVIYELNGEFSSFHTKIFVHGYNDGCDYSTSYSPDKNYYNGVIFIIYVDFTKVYESPRIKGTPPTIPVDVSVDVTGADALMLVVDEVEQVNYCDISVWGDPYLLP